MKKDYNIYIDAGSNYPRLYQVDIFKKYCFNGSRIEIENNEIKWKSKVKDIYIIAENITDEDSYKADSDIYLFNIESQKNAISLISYLYDYFERIER